MSNDDVPTDDLVQQRQWPMSALPYGIALLSAAVAVQNGTHFSPAVVWGSFAAFTLLYAVFSQLQSYYRFGIKRKLEQLVLSLLKAERPGAFTAWIESRRILDRKTNLEARALVVGLLKRGTVFTYLTPAELKVELADEIRRVWKSRQSTESTIGLIEWMGYNLEPDFFDPICNLMKLKPANDRQIQLKEAITKSFSKWQVNREFGLLQLAVTGRFPCTALSILSWKRNFERQYL